MFSRAASYLAGLIKTSMCRNSNTAMSVATGHPDNGAWIRGFGWTLAVLLVLDFINAYVEALERKETAKAEMEVLKKRIVSFSVDLERVQRRNERLQHYNERLQHDNEDLQRENEDLQRQNEDLQRQNEDYQRENENWKTTMHALHNPHDAKKDSEIAILKSQVSELQEKNDKLNEKMEYLHRANTTNATLATDTQNKLDNALWDADGVRLELSETQDTLSATKDRLSSTLEKLDSAQHEISMLSSEIADQAQQATRREATFAHEHVRLNTRVNDVQVMAAARILALQQDLHAQRQDNHALEAKIHGLHNANASLKEYVEDRMSELEWLRYESKQAAEHANWEAVEWLRDTVEAETGRVPLWGGVGFKDEGFEEKEDSLAVEMALEEGGYASADTIELSESEEEEEEEVEDYGEVAVVPGLGWL